MQILASAQGVSCAYPGGWRALDAVDLRIEAGEIVGLIGPNGSGKSTLLGALSGGIRPVSGRVAVAGAKAVSRTARSRIGYAGQDISLDPDMTGRETVFLFARLHGLGARGRSEAEALLKRFGLANRADHRVSTYSGGMRQRLHLLLAFLHDPPLVLLDEPITGLDPEGRELLWSVLHARRERGLAAVVSLHDPAEASLHCTRVAMLASGRIRAQGTPSDLIAAHGSALWRGEIADLGEYAEGAQSTVELRRRLVELEGVKEVDLGRKEISLWLTEEGPKDEGILAILREQSCDIRAYRRQKPDLASAYRMVIGRALEPASVERRQRRGNRSGSGPGTGPGGE